MKKVAILGTGMTTFTDLYDYDLNEMSDLALTRAYESVETKDIDGLFVGSMASGQFLKQGNLGAYLASSANLKCPSMHISAGSASGAAAVRTAYLSILSGVHDVVVVLGVEKMTDSIIGSEQMTTISSDLDHKWTLGMGGTIPAMYAMVAKAHMKEYGTTREQLANVALKNHFHGSHNPKAQFQREIRLQTVLGSKMIADPLRLFDGPAASDGAAAIILASEEYASKVTNEPVHIVGSGIGMDNISLSGRSNLTSFSATEQASKQVYEMAGISANEIDVAEVDDSWAIGEILAIEDLGFFEKGTGGEATESGSTRFDGKVAINTSGGLKARGAPLGAVGVAQVVEIYEQLKDKAGGRQRADAQVGLTHNVGGIGSTAIVHLLKK